MSFGVPCEIDPFPAQHVREQARLEWEEEERRRGQEHLNAILDQSGHILEVQLHDLARDSRSRSRSVSTHGRDRTPADSDDEGTRNSDDDDDEWTDSWLVTGCSDSSLRKWDIASGRVLERMTTDKQQGERTLVWTVGVLGYVYFIGCTLHA